MILGGHIVTSMNVWQDPIGIVYDAVTNLVYLANSISNDISLIGQRSTVNNHDIISLSSGVILHSLAVYSVIGYLSMFKHLYLTVSHLGNNDNVKNLDGCQLYYAPVVNQGITYFISQNSTYVLVCKG